MPQTIDAKALKAMINDGEELALLDVREAGQFGENHLLFAVPAPYSKLEAMIMIGMVNALTAPKVSAMPRTLK